MGSFLFLGCTGVGKTHLAKALAHELFDEGSDDEDEADDIDPDRDAGDTGAIANAFGGGAEMKTHGLVHVDMSEFTEVRNVVFVFVCLQLEVETHARHIPFLDSLEHPLGKANAAT